MNFSTSKILLIIVIFAILYSCSPLEKVPDDKLLLTNNEIFIDNKKTTNDSIQLLLLQKPNSRFLKIPIRLYLNHLSKKNADSSYLAWLNKKPNRLKNLTNLLSKKQVNRLGQSFLVKGYSKFFKKVGEEPVLIDNKKIERSKKQLNGYYKNIGYFDNTVDAKIDTLSKKVGKVIYNLQKKKPYIIDSVTALINSNSIDSIYKSISQNSFIKQNKIYNLTDFDKERKRISTHLRNNGAYYFQVNDISYNVYQDTVSKKIDVELRITDRKITKEELTTTTPHKMYKIEKVAVFVDNNAIKNKSKISDSLTYKNYTLYGSKKIKYRPKAITNAIFIDKDDYYSDYKRYQTTRALGNLNTFTYPNIEFTENKDSTALVASINLSPLKRFNFNPNIDFIHSNIQDFGITGNISVTFRNIFRG
ncbi:MAG TPA: hypothetical protein DDZ41_04765, partial [Flavobacterium sp.]|nr:hypothetical protein [Flavobacterium sp.]